MPARTRWLAIPGFVGLLSMTVWALSQGGGPGIGGTPGIGVLPGPIQPHSPAPEFPPDDDPRPPYPPINDPWPAPINEEPDPDYEPWPGQSWHHIFCCNPNFTPYNPQIFEAEIITDDPEDVTYHDCEEGEECDLTIEDQWIQVIKDSSGKVTITITTVVCDAGGSCEDVVQQFIICDCPECNIGGACVDAQWVSVWFDPDDIDGNGLIQGGETINIGVSVYSENGTQITYILTAGSNGDFGGNPPPPRP